MKANHNKQPSTKALSTLFIIKSKIQNESKSQQSLTDLAVSRSCLSLSQRYKMKANHN